MGYKVYAGGLTADGNGLIRWVDPKMIYSPGGDSVDWSPTQMLLTDAVIRLSKNSVGTFEFTVPYEVQSVLSGKPLKNPYYGKFKLQETFVLVIEDDLEEVFFGYVSEIEDGMDKSQTITCQTPEGLMKHDDVRIPSQSSVYLTWNRSGDNFTTPVIAKKCLTSLNFKDAANGLGYMTICYGEDGTYLEDKTIDTTEQGETWGSQWDVMNNFLLDEYDGYFHFYRKLETEKDWLGPFKLYAWYRADVPDKTSQTITYGTNLLDLTMSRSLPSDFANRVMVYSQVTKTRGWWIFKTTSTEVNWGIAENAASIAKYGVVMRRCAVNNVSSEDKLNELAQEQLKEYDTEPDEELTVEALDLYGSGGAADHLGFLKKTRIVSPPHGIDGWYVCTEAEIALEDAGNKKFKFGNPSKKLTRQQSVAKALLSSAKTQIRGVIGHLNG